MERKTEPAQGRVLIVDDDEPIARSIARTLRAAGFDEIVIECDARAVAEHIDGRDFDSILLDLHMPHMDGFELMRSLVAQIGEASFAPILILTGDTRVDIREKALAAGAKDFVQKPFEPTEMVARVRNLVTTTRMHRRLTSFNELLEDRVEEQTTDIVMSKLDVLDRLARAGEYRDDMTGHHAQRVGTLAGMLARGSGLDVVFVGQMEITAPLHDIGKIGVSDLVLLKAGPLSPEELDAVRKHTEIGAAILSGSESPLLRRAEGIAISHHERWDGGGYPRGLAGEDIPMEGRITAVADAYDALTNDRPYRKGCSSDEAVQEIVRCGGSHFSPDLVVVLERLQSDGSLLQIEERTRRRRRFGPSDIVSEFGAMIRDMVPPLTSDQRRWGGRSDGTPQSVRGRTA